MIRLVRISSLLITGALVYTAALTMCHGIAGSSAAQARGSAEDALAIVVNRSNPVESLSFQELRKIFLGDQDHWSNGRRITVVMLDHGKVERQVALSQIYKMDEQDFNKYFVHRMFTGEVQTAPKVMANTSDMLNFVFNVPGAIGYAKASEINDSVKVVRIDSRLPNEKEYAIRLHGKPTK